MEKGKGVVAIDDNNCENHFDDCPICFEPLVSNDNNRTDVKLRCGHHFHLDCIGSAFNAKSKMECPVCRNVEQGTWLFASAPPNRNRNISFDPSLDEFTAHMWPFNELHTPLWSSRTGPNLARLASRGHLSHRTMNDGDDDDDDDDDEASSSGGRGGDNSGASSSNGISVRVVRRRNGGSRGPFYGPYH